MGHCLAENIVFWATFSLLASLPASRACGSAGGAEPPQNGVNARVAVGGATGRTHHYCISLDAITFYPFRERASAYENFFLLPFTRSYISVNQEEPGILA